MKPMMSLRSRHYSLEESLALAFEEAKFEDIRLRLRPVVESLLFPTFLCSSNDSKLKMSFLGGGTGFDSTEAKVKAAYEAMEWNFQHRVTGLVSADTDWTGLGAGATQEEALIHGITEWIERDGYSLFLLKSFARKNPEKPRLINKLSLPSVALGVITAIESSFSDSLLIVDLTTDLDIPAFLVAFTKQATLVQPMGFGASLYKEEALNHAILEAVQAVTRFNLDAERRRRDQLESLGPRPILIDSFLCPLSSFVQNDFYSEKRWSDLRDHCESLDLSDQVKQFEETLSKNGFTISSQRLFAGRTGFSLTHTQIEGLETFYRIKEGRFDPLTSRGLRSLQ